MPIVAIGFIKQILLLSFFFPIKQKMSAVWVRDWRFFCTDNIATLQAWIYCKGLKIKWSNGLYRSYLELTKHKQIHWH